MVSFLHTSGKIISPLQLTASISLTGLVVFASLLAKVGVNDNRNMIGNDLGKICCFGRVLSPQME